MLFIHASGFCVCGVSAPTKCAFLLACNRQQCLSRLCCACHRFISNVFFWFFLSRAIMFTSCCLLYAAQYFVPNVTRCSFLLVDRLAAELPHMSRAEIEEHEDWYCAALKHFIFDGSYPSSGSLGIKSIWSCSLAKGKRFGIGGVTSRNSTLAHFKYVQTIAHARDWAPDVKI